MTNHDAAYADSDFFFKDQSCTYLDEPLLLVPTAEFCACLMDSFDPPGQSTFFIGAWLDLGLLLVLADSCWFVYLLE